MFVVAHILVSWVSCDFSIDSHIIIENQWECVFVMFSCMIFISIHQWGMLYSYNT